MNSKIDEGPLSPFRYSAEELRVLEQCNRESFFQRCIPLCTIFGGATYYAIKIGKLNPSPRFGVVPKVMGAVLCGYLIGKVSYQHICAEKIMALPNSKLGDMLRARRGRNALTMELPETDAFVGGLSADDKYDDVRKTSHMDMDIDRPLYSDLHDSRPSDSLNNEKQRPATSYDELRRKNREEYDQKRTKPYRGVLNTDDIPSALKTRDEPRTSDPWDSPPTRNSPTNIYGDTWEK